MRTPWGRKGGGGEEAGAEKRREGEEVGSGIEREEERRLKGVRDRRRGEEWREGWEHVVGESHVTTGQKERKRRT